MKFQNKVFEIKIKNIKSSFKTFVFCAIKFEFFFSCELTKKLFNKNCKIKY